MQDIQVHLVRGESCKSGTHFVFSVSEENVGALNLEKITKKSQESLQRRGISVYIHRRSHCGFLQTPKPVQLCNLIETLRKVCGETGVAMTALRHLDIFDAEVMELINVFPVPELPRAFSYLNASLCEDPLENENLEDYSEESSSAAHDEIELEQSGMMSLDVMTAFGALLPTCSEKQLSHLTKRFKDLTVNERELLGERPISIIGKKIEALSQHSEDSEWFYSGPAVNFVNVMAHPKMSTQRQLDWLLFRLNKAKVPATMKISFYPTFYWYFMQISPLKLFRHTRARARELWVLWTRQPFPDSLPFDIQLQLDIMKPGTDACLKCQRLIKSPLIACQDCASFVCLEHKELKVAKPEGLCQAYIGSVQESGCIMKQILKMQRFLDVRPYSDDSAEQNLILQSRLEMQREGCCYGGMCQKHAEAHDILAHIHELRTHSFITTDHSNLFSRRKRPVALEPDVHRMQPIDGSIWKKIEDHLELLKVILIPVSYRPEFVCTKCFPDYAKWLKEDKNAEMQPHAFQEIVSYVKAREAGCKSSLESFDAEAWELEKRRKWRSLTLEEREKSWCPIPGAFLI